MPSYSIVSAEGYFYRYSYLDKEYKFDIPSFMKLLTVYQYTSFGFRFQRFTTKEAVVLAHLARNYYSKIHLFVFVLSEHVKYCSLTIHKVILFQSLPIFLRHSYISYFSIACRHFSNFSPRSRYCCTS